MQSNKGCNKTKSNVEPALKSCCNSKGNKPRKHGLKLALTLPAKQSQNMAHQIHNDSFYSLKVVQKHDTKYVKILEPIYYFKMEAISNY